MKSLKILTAVALATTIASTMVMASTPDASDPVGAPPRSAGQEKLAALSRRAADLGQQATDLDARVSAKRSAIDTAALDEKIALLQALADAMSATGVKPIDKFPVNPRIKDLLDNKDEVTNAKKKAVLAALQAQQGARAAVAGADALTEIARLEAERDQARTQAAALLAKSGGDVREADYAQQYAQMSRRPSAADFTTYTEVDAHMNKTHRAREALDRDLQAARADIDTLRAQLEAARKDTSAADAVRTELARVQGDAARLTDENRALTERLSQAKTKADVEAAAEGAFNDMADGLRDHFGTLRGALERLATLPGSAEAIASLHDALEYFNSYVPNAFDADLAGKPAALAGSAPAKAPPSHASAAPQTPAKAQQPGSVGSRTDLHEQQQGPGAPVLSLTSGALAPGSTGDADALRRAAEQRERLEQLRREEELRSRQAPSNEAPGEF